MMMLIPNLDDFDDLGFLDEDEFDQREQVAPYTRSELKELWLGFRDNPDAVKKLADFAGCSRREAASMIQSFQPSAAAKRAAQADYQRLTAQDTPPAEQPVKPQKQPQKRKANKDDPTITDAEISDIPASDLLASLINDKYGISSILIEGRSQQRAVVVEQFGSLYRLKRTSYRYFRNYDDALAAAEAERLKLRLF